MALLSGFDTPARLRELGEADRERWSQTVASIFAPYVAAHPQFYDPTATDTPAEAQVAPIAWPAFPARLLRGAGSEEERWTRADSTRDEQDEYCEWSVRRDDTGKPTRVTFTSEVPEYWEHLAALDEERVLALYRELVGADVSREELFAGGRYQRGNPRNRSIDGPIAHLTQRTNNLAAAIDLTAKATVLRERDGDPVTDQQDLVACARLGDPFRHSDPQIAAAANNAAAADAEVSLHDPLGLYIDGLITPGMETPDGADPASFWSVERGDARHALRARYEVPAERGYTVGDVRIDGRPIRFGAQLADRVRVRIAAVVKPGSHRPARRPCV
jgi:hypothetical protein